MSTPSSLPTLPTLYLSHGSPMTALEPGAAGAFFRALGPAIDATFGRPRAILAVSAHTLTREPVLLAAPRHPTVHDFSGFPEALYRLRYDAPGAPALAQRVAALLGEHGLVAHVVDEGGLDHGIWSPLRLAWPEADVPVLPLGFDPHATPAQLHALGAALALLPAEGVLVMGTGSLTHNLRLVFGGGRPPLDAPEIAESAAFRAWVHAAATAGDLDTLLDYRARAPHAALMHPTDEHWLPWYPAQGAADAPGARRLHASVTYGCLAMDAYAFGSAAEALRQAL